MLDSLGRQSIYISKWQTSHSPDVKVGEMPVHCRAEKQ